MGRLGVLSLALEVLLGHLVRDLLVGVVVGGHLGLVVHEHLHGLHLVGDGQLLVRLLLLEQYLFDLLALGGLQEVLSLAEDALDLLRAVLVGQRSLALVLVLLLEEHLLETRHLAPSQLVVLKHALVVVHALLALELLALQIRPRLVLDLELETVLSMLALHASKVVHLVLLLLLLPQSQNVQLLLVQSVRRSA